MSAQSHRADPKILGRRTLQKNHRILSTLLRPGLSVLDVGCGIGAITAGIARAVGPDGYVVGLDRDEGHLGFARQEHRGLANLTFERGDATSLPFRAQFDIVTAARTLQWISEPERALLSMKLAAKPAGLLVVLDYSHETNEWLPEPPPEFQLFYRAFLAWRCANGWDNALAAHLPAMCRNTELTGVEFHSQNEITERGDADFTERSGIWTEVIDAVGDQIAAAGFCAPAEVAQARHRYSAWTGTELRRQTLSLGAVVARLPE